MSKKNRPITEIVFTDRRLTGEREEDNPYVTCALYFLVALMSVLLIMVVFVAMCGVEGTSMCNSYRDGDNILMYRFARDFEQGDVVVFDIDYGGEEKRLIKRVVAVGGDEIVFVKSADKTHAALYRKSAGQDSFEAVTEDYIMEPMLCDRLAVGKNPVKIAEDISEAELERCRIVVAEGFLYVMGDNRNDSQDSRVFGAITATSVVGKEIFHFTQGSLLEKIMLLIFGSPQSA